MFFLSFSSFIFRFVSEKPERIFQYPVTVAAFRRYTQDKTRYRTRAELNGFSYRFGNPTNENQLNLTSEV